MDYTKMQARARTAGLSLEVKGTAGWYTFSFIRHGDAMCVAVLYSEDEAETWLDGYTAGVKYPPDIRQHAITAHTVRGRVRWGKLAERAS